MDNIEECGANEGSMPMVPPMPQEDKGNPVTMNVNLNASGKEHVEDLIAMMKNAGVSDAKQVSPDMMPMRHDMERLRDIVDGPKDLMGPKDDPMIPGKDDVPGDDDMTDMGCNDDIEMDERGDGPMSSCCDAPLLNYNDGLGICSDCKENAGPHEDDDVEEDYANEPEEQYGSVDDVIGSGDDLHRTKKSYAATQDGDNPMALEDDIKEALWAQLNNMKFDEGRGRGNKKKAKEDIETNEGRGKGRGKKK